MGASQRGLQKHSISMLNLSTLLDGIVILLLLVSSACTWAALGISGWTSYVTSALLQVFVVCIVLVIVRFTHKAKRRMRLVVGERTEKDVVQECPTNEQNKDQAITIGQGAVLTGC